VHIRRLITYCTFSENEIQVSQSAQQLRRRLYQSAGGSRTAPSGEKHSQDGREIENAVLFVTRSMRRATDGNKKYSCIFRFRKAGQVFFEEDLAGAAN